MRSSESPCEQIWRLQEIEIGSALPKVRSTPSRKFRTPKLIKTPERRSEEILEEACENWLLLLVCAMKWYRLCLSTIWTCPPTRLPRISYCLKPQRPRNCKEQSYFWRIWGMARNLRSCGQMRSHSLSRQFTIPKMTGFMQWIRVTSPWMTGWCSDVSETETCFCYGLGRGNFHQREDSPHLHWRGG